MNEKTTSEIRVDAVLMEAALDAYDPHRQQPRQCCSCGAVTAYGCTVPLADGTEPWACSDCNANPACWPNDDDLLFVPLLKPLPVVHAIDCDLDEDCSCGGAS